MLALLSNIRTSAQQRRYERSVQRSWERARYNAATPSAQAEIDAIFARHRS